MRKMISLLLILVSILGLFGCKDADGRQSESATEDNNLLSVQSMDTLVQPYENFLWDQSWAKKGWIFADGLSISYDLPDICEEIPQVIYSDDFEIIYGKGVEFRRITILNSDFEEIHHSSRQNVIETLEEGTYYLILEVKVQGKYIKKQKEYETSGYECAYKLIIQNQET